MTTQPTATFDVDGIRITGPAKVKRDAFISVYADIMTDRYDTTVQHHPHDAWADAVAAAYFIYGAIAVEDNTLGQVAQVNGYHGELHDRACRGRRFSFGLSLYGKAVRPINARLSQSR